MENNFGKIEAVQEEESNLPAFTQETGIAKITNIDDLKSFVKCIVPEDNYTRKHDDILKHIEITNKQSKFFNSVIIDQKGDKLNIYSHDIHDPESDESKSFELHQITDMSAWLRKLVEKHLRF